jgi:hypothetical protein
MVVALGLFINGLVFQLRKNMMQLGAFEMETQTR